MRVLQVFEPVVGGVHVYVRTLTAGLRERGHDVEVAAVADPALEAGFRDVGAPVHAVDLVAPMVAPGHDARALAQLRGLLARGRYDLVHVHDTKGGVLGRLAAATTRTPCVYSPHSFAHTGQRHRPRRGQGARRALTLNIERALAPLSRAIVCVSEAERRVALADRVAGARRLRVVHPGVPGAPDAVVPDPDLLELKGDGVLVGYMARFNVQKGPAVLVNALVRLRDRDALPAVALIGEGPLEDDVRDRLAAAGLGDRVRMLPFVPPVWPRLAAFDVFVLPSLFEGLPVGVLEAMSAGVPVVASGVDGVPEAVEDGVTGLLVPPGEPERLADALAALAADPARRASLAGAGRARYAEEFTPSRMVERTEAVYADVLKER
jgi:glycosyltransferase involved in cell wall biosynthesis